MLNGLEISEVNYTNVDNLILGSEFNSITKLNVLKKLISNKKVSDYFELKTDIVSDIKNVLSYDLTHTLGNFIHDIEVSEHIPGQRKLAKENDFIISRLRSYLQEFAVVEKRNYEQVFSSEYLVYRPITNKISSSLLVAYCLTKEVQTILNCSQYGTAHPRFFEFVFSKLPILDVLLSLNNRIENMFAKAFKLREQSKTLYKQSETLLLKELDLLDFKPSTENIAIKTLSESFGSSGRLDSEFYLPKYDDVIAKIKGYKGGFESINNICTLSDKNYKPQNTQYYKYVELSNIGNTGDITGFTHEVGKKLPSRARRQIKENDVIISTIEGSLEKIAIVRKEFNNSLCSTGFYVIKSRQINSETLLVLFKNKTMQQILKKNCSGTILTGMNKDEFLNILIPIIDQSIQTKIEQKIKESFKLKEQSKQLLESAKKVVELAIEQGEDKALVYIENLK